MPIYRLPASAYHAETNAHSNVHAAVESSRAVWPVFLNRLLIDELSEEAKATYKENNTRDEMPNKRDAGLAWKVPQTS